MKKFFNAFVFTLIRALVLMTGVACIAHAGDIHDPYTALSGLGALILYEVMGKLE